MALESELEQGAWEAILKVAGGPPVACQWFARCDQEAVTTADAGPLGYVPTCQRCHDFAKGVHNA
jgi:hypothetical protein